MNITATITSVTGSKHWKGDAYFVEGEFADGSSWSSMTKDVYKDRREADLRALIGKPGEFEVEAGKEYMGKKQWRLKSWPGRPAQGAGGGGRGGFAPRYRDSEQGTREERDSIHRSVAAQEAIKMAVAGKIQPTPESVLGLANSLYAWLVDSPGKVQAPPPSAEPAASQPQIQGPTLPAQIRAAIAGAVQARNLELLTQIEERIKQRSKEGKLTNNELADLANEVADAQLQVGGALTF